MTTPVAAMRSLLTLTSLPPSSFQTVESARPLKVSIARIGFAVAFVALALVQANAHADSQPTISRVCEPEILTKDSATTSPIIVNRFKADGPMLRLEGVVGGPLESPDAKVSSGLSGVRAVEVTVAEATDLCRQGFAVDVLDLSRIPRVADGRQKTVVQPVANLPSGFTIARTWNLWQGWATYGNFWVPATLPYGHTYQVVDFTVTPSNYDSSGDLSHLAVSVLTLSNSNLNNDFDGKGLTLWATSSRCQSSWLRAALQSWAIQGFSDPPGACANPALCSNPVYDGVTNNPNTCGPWDAASTQRFLVGANIWQNSIYWLCDAWSCPAWASPAVDSSTPNFRPGGAGVAFLHVLSNNVTWTLSFQNVISYTNP